MTNPNPENVMNIRMFVSTFLARSKGITSLYTGLYSLYNESLYWSKKTHTSLVGQNKITCPGFQEKRAQFCSLLSSKGLWLNKLGATGR